MKGMPSWLKQRPPRQHAKTSLLSKLASRPWMSTTHLRHRRPARHPRRLTSHRTLSLLRLRPVRCSTRRLWFFHARMHSMLPASSPGSRSQDARPAHRVGLTSTLTHSPTSRVRFGLARRQRPKLARALDLKACKVKLLHSPPSSLRIPLRSSTLLLPHRRLLCPPMRRPLRPRTHPTHLLMPHIPARARSLSKRRTRIVRNGHPFRHSSAST